MNRAFQKLAARISLTLLFVIVGIDDALAQADAVRIENKPATSLTQYNKFDWNQHVNYLGAFRLPKYRDARSRTGYGGYQLAVRPASKTRITSVFTVGHPHDQLVAEFEVPNELAVSKDGRALPEARVLQGFGDITSGLRAKWVQDSRGKDMRIRGLCWTQIQGEERLLVMINRYYNVEGKNYATLVVAEPNTKNANAHGVYHVGSWHSEIVGGWLADVPTDFAAEHLDGKRILCGKSLNWRALSSPGPCTFAFNPDETVVSNEILRHGTSLKAARLLSYASNRQRPELAFPTWTGGNLCEGSVFARTSMGEQAIIFFGRQGDVAKSKWYGLRKHFEQEFGLPAVDAGKGYHSNPYHGVAWLYRPMDLVAVARDMREPSSVQAYQTINLKPELLDDSGQRVVGAALDRTTNRIYVLQSKCFTPSNSFEPLSVIHVWQVL